MLLSAQVKVSNLWSVLFICRNKGKVGYVPSMYLKPYFQPKVRFVTTQNERRSSTINLAQLQVPGAANAGPFSGPAKKLSRSQGNLLSPGDYQPGANGLHTPQRALSLELLAEPQPRPHSAQPMIRVERPPEEERSLGDRQKSLSSEWESEDSSELSFSDDSMSVDAHSVSMPESAWHRQRAFTPQPTVTPDDRLASSKSEPDLFKGPTTPTVPPRPHAKEILTRCTTITRKAAQSPTKNRLSPGPVQSR